MGQVPDGAALLQDGDNNGQAFRTKKSWLQNPSYQTLRQSLQQGPNICLTRSRNHHNLRSTSGKERNKLWMWEKIKQHNSPDSSQSLGLCVELSSVYTLPSSLQRSSSLCIRSYLPCKCWASLTPCSAGSAFPCSPPWGYLLETPCEIFFFFCCFLHLSKRWTNVHSQAKTPAAVTQMGQYG